MFSAVSAVCSAQLVPHVQRR